MGNNDELLADGLIADDLNWVGIGELTGPMNVDVKIRYNMPPVPAVVEPGPANGAVTVTFAAPQRAVSPGQSLVMYENLGESVLGGGTIQRRV